MTNPQSLNFFLAILADIYTPVLLVLSLVLCLQSWRNLLLWMQLCLSAVIVYGWMFADKIFHIWPYFGLDYSTHTAAALVLVMFINSALKWRFYRVNGLFLLAYAELMVWLDYHSWWDILSTAAVVGIGVGMVYILLKNNKRNKLITVD